jgi:hypothetical protein
MNKKNRIMLTSNKSSSNDNRGEALKPSTGRGGGLFETIERTAEMTDMALRTRVVGGGCM